MPTPSTNEDQPVTLLHYFYHWEQQQPDKVYLRQPVGNQFVDYTWGEVGQQARRLATYLNSLGLPPGSNIGLISKNCAHWIIADLAILISGHVSVPFYPTLTGPQLRQVLDHSQCQVLIVGKIDNWPLLKPSVPESLPCVAFPDYTPNASAPDPDHTQWQTIQDQYAPLMGTPETGLDEVFSIVYTSGTTGNPKGVMVSYKAAWMALQTCRPQVYTDLPEARFFSYLPLCHLAERSMVEFLNLCIGGTIYFAESLDSFAANLVAARPTHFLGVPRIWTKFQQGVLAKIPQQKLDRLLRIPIVSGLVKRKIRQGLGLNDARLVITGAAPMPVPLIQWFRRLGIHILEVYGMSESTAVISFMPRNAVKDGTVGRVLDGMEARFDPETNELLVRSNWLMMGYYREPALTEAALPDGWLATGDVGELDDEGYLKITGRVKDKYKSPKGEYIAPVQIELGFADNSFVEQIYVGGQLLPQPMALVVLSDTGRKADRLLVGQSLEQTVQSVNTQLYSYEHIRKVVVVKDPWSVENNQLTPTMKIKRNVIENHYKPYMERWFDQSETIIWEE
ncbi:AMP-binding protein [Telluribacter humicola]|uniref:AMP-binding protein n=1 Tax=Telluribacter humicola TaxID=1720261 RepID=UPI001A97CA09|nr:AMP-binding protein [Telluribacter humicola]